MKKSLIFILALFIIGGFVFAFLGCGAGKGKEASGTLVLYTAANEKIEDDLIAGFSEKYPDIKIERINLGSGAITSRIIAEKSNPQADVVWGLFDSYQKTLRDAGAIKPYKPKGIENINKEFVDPDNFYTGHFVTFMTIGVNTDIIAEKKLPMPNTWEDLANPVYKGLINIASPAQSGTGMTIITNLFDMYDGWSLVDEIDKNVFQYNTSGGVAGRQAARGEIAIGLTYDTAVLSLQEEGFPVKAVFPPKTIYTVEAGSLINNAKNENNAKLYLDYMCSEDAFKKIEQYVAAVTLKDFQMSDSWKPKIEDVDLYKPKKVYDLEKFANDWSERYQR